MTREHAYPHGFYLCHFEQYSNQLPHCLYVVFGTMKPVYVLYFLPPPPPHCLYVVLGTMKPVSVLYFLPPPTLLVGYCYVCYTSCPPHFLLGIGMCVILLAPHTSCWVLLCVLYFLPPTLLVGYWYVCYTSCPPHFLLGIAMCVILLAPHTSCWVLVCVLYFLPPTLLVGYWYVCYTSCPPHFLLGIGMCYMSLFLVLKLRHKENTFGQLVSLKLHVC